MPHSLQFCHDFRREPQYGNDVRDDDEEIKRIGKFPYQRHLYNGSHDNKRHHQYAVCHYWLLAKQIAHILSCEEIPAYYSAHGEEEERNGYKPVAYHAKRTIASTKLTTIGFTASGKIDTTAALIEFACTIIPIMPRAMMKNTENIRARNLL